MRFLVTGGAGFIGSHLSRELVRRGHSVVILDNMLHACAAPPLTVPGRLETRIGDIRNEELMVMLAADSEMVLHLAAHINVDLVNIQPRFGVDVNVNGTLNVLEVCRRLDKSMLYMSSSEVYGAVTGKPHDEHSPTNPPHPYGATKLAAEKLATAYRSCYGMKILTSRSFNTYGPGQSLDSYGGFISKSIIRALTGEPVVVFGDGKQTRDYIHVHDLVEGLIAQIDRMLPGPVVFASGAERTVETIAEYIAEKWGQAGVSYIGPRRGELARLVGDSSYAKEALKWEPKTEFYGEGLESVWRQIKVDMRL